MSLPCSCFLGQPNICVLAGRSCTLAQQKITFHVKKNIREAESTKKHLPSVNPRVFTTGSVDKAEKTRGAKMAPSVAKPWSCIVAIGPAATTGWCLGAVSIAWHDILVGLHYQHGNKQQPTQLMYRTFRTFRRCWVRLSDRMWLPRLAGQFRLWHVPEEQCSDRNLTLICKVTGSGESRPTKDFYGKIRIRGSHYSILWTFAVNLPWKYWRQ